MIFGVGFSNGSFDTWLLFRAICTLLGDPSLGLFSSVLTLRDGDNGALNLLDSEPFFGVASTLGGNLTLRSLVWISSIVSKFAKGRDSCCARGDKAPFSD